MSLILNIDTAVNSATISIASDGHILGEAFNIEQKDQGAFIQPAIASIIKNTGIKLTDLNAVAVVAGPGSYTGLRVGMASAKGLCYALSKPLITIGTLELLAYQTINQLDINQNDLPTLFCPMVDARRMEVFTAVFDKDLNTILTPCAIVIDENSFANLLLNNKIIFSGNGSEKWKKISRQKNAHFFQPKNKTLYMNELSFKKCRKKDFSELAYTEPMYIKEFYSPGIS
jgi:tRNA threonylcarbamoyladenosine biosynthesis protein TsaB